MKNSRFTIDFRPKLFSTLKGYNFESLSKDFMAGIIVGIVAIPLAIAFGIASGVGPTEGLVTAIIAGLLISVFGGSKVQIGGPCHHLRHYSGVWSWRSCHCNHNGGSHAGTDGCL